MKWIKFAAIGAGVLLLLAVIAPWFYSLDELVPKIEKAAAVKLQEPVKIGSLRVALLPLPHATADSITVGKTEDLRVGKIVVTPAIGTLLSDTKVLRTIDVSGLVLTQKAIDRIPVWTKADPKATGPAPVRIESVRLNGAVVKLDKATVGPLDASISLNERSEPVEARVSTADGKLKINVTPNAGGYAINAIAKAWTVPAGMAITFDELGIQGTATLNGADLKDVSAKLYGGTVKGATTIAWQKGFQLKGMLDVQQVEIRPLLKAMGRPDNVSGRLNAKPVFSASAKDAARIAGALRLETPFSVQNGVLHGVDISKAATSLISKEGGKGGETRFDRLSGHLVLDRGTRRLTTLNVASGSISATGNVTISPNDDLSGRIDAKIAAAKLGSAAVPLNVSGTTQSPILLPTGATVAGAALGTAILGPGVGTSVGAKVGGWTEGLFGRKGGAKK